jgi:hypothetical protein
MIMQDSLDKWKAGGPEISTRLPELMTMLVGEIGDPGLAMEFSEKLERLINI